MNTPYWIPHRGWKITYLVTGSHYCECCDLYWENGYHWQKHTEERWHRRERETWAVLRGTRPFSGKLHRDHLPPHLRGKVHPPQAVPKKKTLAKFEVQHQAAGAAVAQWRDKQRAAAVLPTGAYYCECCAAAFVTEEVLLTHLRAQVHRDAERQWMTAQRGFYFIGRLGFWDYCREHHETLVAWKRQTRTWLGLMHPSRRKEWLLLRPEEQTRHRLRQCYRKACYRTETEAVAAIPPGAGLITVYACTLGNHYHLGHINKHTLRTYSQARRLA